ncbi:GapA-binding peptide SR1P [Paenibacillus aestuarii]|uniref:GapA-binding peptide SR1P n=1 Tax=Paenibacillus aestuarii TaxID=516965 RepID=A0ABW0K5I7_9BACL|nr:GapA-binding peptide SR1P [Paenibacillus aestuarii]
MSYIHQVKVKSVQNDLGVILCKHCNAVIATLPTNGVKKFYNVCSSPECAEKDKREGAGVQKEESLKSR